MKCEMPGCRRELDPDNKYETDVGGKYRRVCERCYEKSTAIDQVGEGQELNEGSMSVAVQLAF